MIVAWLAGKTHYVLVAVQILGWMVSLNGLHFGLPYRADGHLQYIDQKLSSHSLRPDVQPYSV